MVLMNCFAHKNITEPLPRRCRALPVALRTSAPGIVIICTSEIIDFALFSNDFEGFRETLSGSGKPFALGSACERNDASTCAEPFIFHCFQCFCSESNSFPGAVPNAHGRNRNHLRTRKWFFACFSTVFEGFRETVCGSGKPFAPGSACERNGASTRERL